MHETHLLQNIIRYLQDEERAAARNIKKIHVSLSEFGGITEEHFREHFKAASSGTRWASLNIEIRKIPYGPEFEITRIDFK